MFALIHTWNGSGYSDSGVLGTFKTKEEATRFGIKEIDNMELVAFDLPSTDTVSVRPILDDDDECDDTGAMHIVEAKGYAVIYPLINTVYRYDTLPDVVIEDIKSSNGGFDYGECYDTEHDSVIVIDFSRIL